MTIDGATYTLDNAGNRTAKTDQRTAVATSYGYDAIYQLLSATPSGGPAESYTYDAVGNRLSSAGVPSYSYNSSNQLSSDSVATYGYDLNGNAGTKTDSTGITTYAWDYENRLTSVTLPGSGGTVSFKYDPWGRRIYKSSSTGTSIYAYDVDNLIEETNSAGAVVARYTQTQNIDEPLAMLRSGTTSYYNSDGLGSITSLASAAGSLVQTYTFDSFGKQVSSSGSLTNPFKYTGRESDTETGLYYYRARYYDPITGRFDSEDPMNLSAGLNFYAYVHNNAALLNDPYGLWENTRHPGPPDKNTIVCDGEDGITVHLNENLDLVPDFKACLGPCTTKHEEVHKQQALAYNPRICKGSKKGIQVGFSNDVEQDMSEIAAHLVGLKCYREQLAQEPCEQCRGYLRDQIQQSEKDLKQFRKLLPIDISRSKLHQTP